MLVLSNLSKEMNVMSFSFILITAIFAVFTSCSEKEPETKDRNFREISDFEETLNGYANVFSGGDIKQQKLRATTKSSVFDALEDFNFSIVGELEVEDVGKWKEHYVVVGNLLYQKRTDEWIERYSEWGATSTVFYERDIDKDERPTGNWKHSVYGEGERNNACAFLAGFVAAFLVPEAEYKKTKEPEKDVYIANTPSAITILSNEVTVIVLEARLEISAGDSLLLIATYAPEGNEVQLTAKIVLGGQKITIPQEALDAAK